MRKLSLSEQFDQAVERLLGGSSGTTSQVDERLAPLVSIAADLRHLPRPEFKTKLKADLLRSSLMTTVAETPTTVRTLATPRLTFKNAVEAINFYQNALGAREVSRFEIEGKIPHAELKIGDSVILLAEEWPEGGRFSAETIGQCPVQLSLQVEDVDSFSARAVAAGMKPVRPVMDQFYGRREGTFIDPFGYTWNISTVKEEMSVEEMHRRFEQMQARQAKPAVDPIREGFRTITPYMIAPDGPALLEFTKNAFGAEELFRDVGSAGGIHGEVKLGDSMLMIGGGIPGKEFRGTPSTIALHVYVKNVDAVYEQALAAGATSLHGPMDQEYGERSVGIKDPAGNYWYVATSKGERYVPEGLNDVNVYMHPLRAEPVINFLQRAFGAHDVQKYASPDGVIHHAKVRVGTSILEMGEAHGPYQPTASVFYLYVPDVDATYQRAIIAGASSIFEPADQPYGDRNAGVKDPFGNTWYIAAHVKDVESKA